jgi:hypothetical protein
VVSLHDLHINYYGGIMSDTEKLEEAKVIIADLIRYWVDNKGWFTSTEKARKFLRENT